MPQEDVAPNWVDRLANEIAVLEANADRLWADVKMSLKSATQSFRERFDGVADAEQLNGNQFRVSRRIPFNTFTREAERTLIVDLHFNKEAFQIEVSCDAPCRSQIFQMRVVDGQARLYQTEHVLTPDQVSDRVLRDVFRAGQRRHTLWASPRVYKA